MTLALFCVAVVVVSLLGGLLPLATVLSHTRLQVYLSFSAGAMLGAAFFHMMPEAVRMGSPGTLALDGGRPPRALLPRAVLRLPPPRAPGGPGRPCPTHPHEHAQAAGHRRAWSTRSRPAERGRTTKGTSLHWGAAAFGLDGASLAGGVALASAAAATHGAGTASARPPGASSSPRSSTSRPTP